MNTERWGLIFLLLGLTIFSVGIGIHFGVVGYLIGLGVVLMFIGMTFVFIPGG